MYNLDMKKQQVITAIEKYVRSIMQKDSSGHDYWHIDRVRKIALKIGKKENADLFVVELASLLHDIDDWKFKKGGQRVKKVKSLLSQLSVEQKVINNIINIIKNVSYKGSKVKRRLRTIEAKVVYDADKLDTLGAIGIARIFATGANRERVLYNPEIPLSKKVGDYRKRDSYSSIHHFYDKILTLKNTLNTKTAKKMAEPRHKYIKQYLNQFFKEWKGK